MVTGSLQQRLHLLLRVRLHHLEAAGARKFAQADTEHLKVMQAYFRLALGGLK